MTPEKKQQKKQLHFEFLEPPTIEGVTPELVFDLYDILTKFGKVDIKQQAVEFKYDKEDDKLYLVRSVVPEAKNFSVSKDLMLKMAKMRPIITNMGLVF